MNSLGAKIKGFRKRAGLSQMELEMRVGLSAGSLSRIENNVINPTKETLLKMLEVLDLSNNEILSLLGITKVDNFEAVVKSARLLNNKLNLDYVLQSAVNEIVYELKLLGGFITLKQENKLYSKAVTQNWVINMALKLIPGDFYSLSVDIDKDKNNLMVKSFLFKRVYISNDLKDFIVPAVNRTIADTLQRVTNTKSAISLPIVLNDKSIGTIYFSQSYITDFEDKIDALKIFTEHVALAINNAGKYEELQAEIKRLKNGE